MPEQLSEIVAGLVDETGKVNEQSAAVLAMSKPWFMLSSLVGGTESMRAAGETFLPRWPKEEDDDYRERLNTSVLFNVFEHTATSFSAKPFARPMNIQNVADGLEKYFNNIDALGTDIHTFAGQIMLANLRFGLHGVLVEAPKSEGVRTRQQEIDAGIRPYLTQYDYKSILGWRSKHDGNGNSFLTQLRLKECITEPDGLFGERQIEQVRVLEPGIWQVWRQRQVPNEAKQEWFLFDHGTTSIKKVPFVFFYGVREGFGIGKSPLLDIGYLNVEHWQSASDQQNILHVARVPVLFAKGFTTTDALTIGARSACSSISPEADMKYVEHTGAAVGAGRQSLLDLEDRMRQIGADLLVQRPAVTTATAVQSDDESGRSILQKICEEFEDSLEICLQLMGEYEGKASKPTVQVYKDFKSAQMSEKTGDLLLRATDSGHVSKQTMFDHLKRADVIDPTYTWEDEQKRLNAESPLRKQLSEDNISPKAAD